MQKRKIAAMTLGCKVNSYDTEAMLELFVANGYEIAEFEEFADVYLVNTCTVTNLGDKKSRQMLRRARKNNPNAVVVAAGCYAQVSPDEVSKIPEVDLVIGTKERSKVVAAVEKAMANREKAAVNLVTDIKPERVFEPLSVKHLNNRTRAFLKIQEGCNQFCTYCIIPYARGAIRSRPMDDVLAEVKELAESGYKEVVLAGIHVASYGKDLKSGSLLEIIRKVHDTDIERIRLSSIEPRVITSEFLAALTELPKVCNHFHLSLQSGCDKTLARMNRKYTAGQYREAAVALRRAVPEAALTTDIIVGFPGETEEDFLESYEFVKEMGFSKIHVFPYSPKSGTPAAGYEDQVSAALKNSRAKKMLALGQDMAEAFLQGCVGKRLTVLYETKSPNGAFTGHTTNYVCVETYSEENLINTIQNVNIISIKKDIAVSENIFHVM